MPLCAAANPPSRHSSPPRPASRLLTGLRRAASNPGRPSTAPPLVGHTLLRPVSGEVGADGFWALWSGTASTLLRCHASSLPGHGPWTSILMRPACKVKNADHLVSSRTKGALSGWLVQILVCTSEGVLSSPTNLHMPNDGRKEIMSKLQLGLSITC